MVDLREPVRPVEEWKRSAMAGERMSRVTGERTVHIVESTNPAKLLVRMVCGLIGGYNSFKPNSEKRGTPMCVQCQMNEKKE